MTFPMINIQESDWDPLNYDEPILYNEFYYSTDIELFNHQLLNKIYCDTNGDLHKITHLLKPTSFWRNTLKFLPGVYKCTLKFRKMGKKMPLEDLKQFILERIKSFGKNGFQLKWIIMIENAKTYVEIIDGRVD